MPIVALLLSAQAHGSLGIAIALTAAVVIIGIWLRVGARRLERRLGTLAETVAGHYTATDALDLPRRYRRLAIMQQGHDRRASHLVSGTLDDHPLICFEMRYDAGFGGKRRTEAWAVAVVELRDVSLPRVCLANEPLYAHPAFWLDQAAPLPPESGSLRPLVDASARPCCVECRGELLAIYTPMAGIKQDFAWLLESAAAVLRQVAAPNRTS